MSRAESNGSGPDTAPEGRRYGGLSQVERVARRRDQFIEAGLNVFGTIGYRSATVRKVCKEAGLTDRYFYESFEDMEDLLAAVYLAQSEVLRGRLLTMAGSVGVETDPRALIRRGLGVFFEWFEDPRVARLSWHEVVGVSERIDALYIEATRGFSRIVLEIARSVRPSWSVDPAEEQVLGIALTGGVVQVGMDWLLSDYANSRETMIAATARLFDGVLATMQE